MNKCFEDIISEQEIAFDEVRFFPETSMLTSGEDLLNHFENLSKLESCDPLSSAYRVGTSVIIQYNVGGREYA